MTVCVVAQIFSVCKPQVTAPPLVERRLSLSPAESLSVYVWKLYWTSYHSNIWISLGAPTKYLAARENFNQSASRGRDILSETFFAAK